MTNKLTLSVDKEVIEHAKNYAKDNGRSLSQIVESYLKSLTEKRQENTTSQYSPKLKRLIGAVKLPENFNEEAEKRAYLENKNR